MNETKFTVIVPTRERADTLRHCLRTIVRQEYNNLQILVSDNFSGDDTEQVVREIKDSRIRYVNTGRRLEMSRNFDFALSHVSDGWVTYLGDDDGLLPNALSVVNEIIRETGVKAMSSKFHHYTWPNFNGVIPPNQLTIQMGQGYEVRDCRTSLDLALNGKLNYFELPGIYIGGFAEYDTLNRMRNDRGYFYCAKSPDVYAAVALASTLDRYVYRNQPLSICGASAHSIGASGLGHSTNASAAEQFMSEEEIPFHPALGNGRVKSIQLAVYEAYLQASHLHHEPERTPLAHQLALSIASAGAAESEVRSYCSRIAEKQGIDFGSVESSARRLSSTARVQAIFKKLKSPFQGFQVDGEALGIRNIFDASLACQSICFQASQNRNWRLGKLLNVFSSRPKPAPAAVRKSFSSGN